MPPPLTEIIVRLPDRTQHRYVLEPGEYAVGRDPSCQIRIDSPEVSRQHARLEIGDEDLRFEDLGSNNGSMIGGEQVSGSIRLRLPQRIQLGSAVLEIKRLGGGAMASVAPRAAPALSEPLFPTRGEEYTVGTLLGQGGMGAVLAAEDVKVRRQVAMKRLRLGRAASRESLMRFLQEARVLGRLEHPNIVPLYDLDLDAQGEVFYTMKLVKGVTLHRVLGEIKAGQAETVAKYSLTQLLTIFQKVCDAVSFAHSKGIIHRDLKPENIMLGDFGEVLVMDWGLAKILKSEPERERESPITDGSPNGLTRPSVLPLPGERDGVRGNEPPTSPASLHTPGHRSLTSAAQADAIEGFQEAELAAVGAELRTLEGKIMGTPNFMAPEQAEGRIGDIDARTDVFALGGILYNLLTLRMPAEGATAAEAMDKIKRGYIAPPIYYNQAGALEPDGSKRVSPLVLAHCPGGKVPEALSAVAVKALAHEPAERYQSVAELQKDIAAYQGGFATSAEQASPLKQLGLFFRRHKTVSIAAALIAVLAGGFTLKLTLTLTESRKSAPAFYSEARAMIEEKDLTNALAKIGIALALRPDVAAYHCLRGNIYQTLLQFEDAQAAYGLALKKDPNQPLVAESLALSRKLLAAKWSTSKQKAADLEELWRALIHQGRTAEAQILAPKIERSKVDQEYLDRWKDLFAKAGIKGDLKLDPDGRLQLDLSNSSITNLAPLKELPLDWLSLAGTAVADLRPLQGTLLSFLNLEGTRVADLSPLGGIPLRELNLTGTAVADLSPLKGMPLVELRVIRTKVSDLRPLKGMPLKYLYSNGTEVGDLSPLHGIRLEMLLLEETKVTDLSPLAGMPLRDLNLKSTQIADLSPLTGMPLNTVILGRTKVTDLSALKGMPIRQLDVSETLVTNLGIIKEMPLTDFQVYGCTNFNDACMRLLSGKRLWRLTMGQNPVSDLSILRGMPLRDLALNETGVTNLGVLQNMPLETLYLPGTKVQDFSLLKGLTLKTLSLSSSRFSDVSMLQGMPLDSLEMNNCPVSDISPLRGMRLRSLRCGGTRVSDIGPLKGMPLIDLHLTDTPVRDLTPLIGAPLREIGLRSTPINDITALRGMPLVRIWLDKCEQLKDLRPLAECKELETLYISNTDQNIDFLRQLPKLKFLSYDGSDTPVAEFWKARALASSQGK